MTDLLLTALQHVRDGKHASSVLEALFREHQPTAGQAGAWRQALFDAIRAEGFPVWLADELRRDWGARASRLITALSDDASTYIRVNTLRTTVDAVLQDLAPHEPSRCDLPNALRIARPFGLFRTASFQGGWFEQQDLASQRVALALDVRPGMRVIDACAGAGGKALHLAALMQNRGRIVALDVSDEKLHALRTRAARAGADIIETRHISTTKVIKRLAGTADRVLIDAPCSGTGVVRRNPDILLHLTPAMLDELVEMQAAILRRSAVAVKPGGRVVYATCSLLKRESEEQVARFLASTTDFAEVHAFRTMPDEVDEDGFYVAVLQRTA